MCALGNHWKGVAFFYVLICKWLWNEYIVHESQNVEQGCQRVVGGGTTWRRHPMAMWYMTRSCGRMGYIDMLVWLVIVWRLDHFQFVHHNLSREMIEFGMPRLWSMEQWQWKIERASHTKMVWNVQWCSISTRNELMWQSKIGCPLFFSIGYSLWCINCD